MTPPADVPREPSAEDVMWRDLEQTMADFNEQNPPTLPGLPKTPEDDFADSLREAHRLLGLCRGEEYPDAAR